MIYDRRLVHSVYNAVPVLLQESMLSGYGLLKRRERASSVFRSYSRDLDDSQWMSPGDLEGLQDERVERIVRHAYDNVPYYRNAFTACKLTPADVKTASDLYKVPVLTKELVRRHWADLCARNIPRGRATVARSGGTTGVPLAFLIDKDRLKLERAMILRHWSWGGFRSGDRIVLLRGFTLIPSNARSTYWRRDWVDRRIYLSGFHLSEANLPTYLDQLSKWAAPYLAGYPSSLMVLARYMKLQQITLRTKAIFTSSEMLTPLERGLIEDRFRCQVFDYYGSGERLVGAQQCADGRYHQNVEFGVLQADCPIGAPAAPGAEGRLIHTGLTNLSMPLIRYDSGDIGSLPQGPCPCGRGLPIAGPVRGRKDDVLITADGRVMPQAGLDQIHEFVDRIERCQLVQHTVGEVTIRVVPLPGFNDDDISELTQQLARRIGNSTRIRVQCVDHLELSATGKERFIVSALQRDSLAEHHDPEPLTSA